MGNFTCVLILIAAVVIVAAVLLMGILLVVGGATAAKAAARQRAETTTSSGDEVGMPPRSGLSTVGIIALVAGMTILILVGLLIELVVVAWFNTP